jgi:3-vinyl bacteriochlorophyllide hydratase
MPQSVSGARIRQKTGWRARVLNQQANRQESVSLANNGQGDACDFDNIVTLFPARGPLITSPKVSVVEPWPNAACKAWQPSPDYDNPPLYTPEQRIIRDQTPWTLVQAILAPLQFLVFLVSLGLVWRYLATGQGYEIATFSIVAKTIILYVIMITGSIWEKVVFDEWLFADAFFWEDVFSMLVLSLQTLYLGALIFGWWDARTQVLIALAAYVTYVINAAQFVWKLRAARLQAAKTAADLRVAA